jgi:hypothetical protein
MNGKKESFNYEILSICPLNTCLHLTITRKSQILFFIAGQSILILTSTVVASVDYLSNADYGTM